MQRYTLNGGESTSEPYTPESLPLAVSPTWGESLASLPDYGDDGTEFDVYSATDDYWDSCAICHSDTCGC